MYDSILIFESPLTIGEDSIYGIVYESTPYGGEINRDYVGYLVGCKKWIDNGNEITNDRRWWDKATNVFYEGNEDFVANYCEQAYAETPISYFFQENLSFDYTEEDVDGTFIKSERFWNWAIGYIEEINLYGSSYYEDYEQYEDSMDYNDSDMDLPF